MPTHRALCEYSELSFFGVLEQKMEYAILICVASLMLVGSTLSADDPVVSLSSGLLIRGSKLFSSKDQEFLAFRGIKYAQSPIGPLRFQVKLFTNQQRADNDVIHLKKDPLPALPWKGTFDASKEGPACLQFDERLKDFRGTEDCLCLNVYTRNVSRA